MVVDRRPRISIFDYDEHQAFIKDYFESLRKRIPSLSYQKIQQELNLSSKSQAFRLANGTLQNFSKKFTEDLIKYMKLNHLEKKYFGLLFWKYESQSEDELKVFQEKLNKIKSMAKPLWINCRYEKFLSRWYFPALRELAIISPNPDDYEKMGEEFYPPISAEEVELGLKILMEDGILEQTDDGYIQTNALMESIPDVRKMFVRDYQIKMIECIKNSFPYSEMDLQHLTAQTFSVNQDGVQKLKSRISSFLRDVVSVVTENDDGECQVFQLNMQLLPLTKSQGILDDGK